MKVNLDLSRFSLASVCVQGLKIHQKRFTQVKSTIFFPSCTERYYVEDELL